MTLAGAIPGIHPEGRRLGALRLGSRLETPKSQVWFLPITGEARGGGLSVILPSVGFDVGFAVLPALRADFRQGRVAWGLLMVSSGAMQTGLPSVNYRSRGLIIPSAALA